MTPCSRLIMARLSTSLHFGLETLCVGLISNHTQRSVMDAQLGMHLLLVFPAQITLIMLLAKRKLRCAILPTVERLVAGQFRRMLTGTCSSTLFWRIWFSTVMLESILILRSVTFVTESNACISTPLRREFCPMKPFMWISPGVFPCFRILSSKDRLLTVHRPRPLLKSVRKVAIAVLPFMLKTASTLRRNIVPLRLNRNRSFATNARPMGTSPGQIQ